jgi:hypothetical protein
MRLALSGGPRSFGPEQIDLLSLKDAVREIFKLSTTTPDFHFITARPSEPSLTPFHQRNDSQVESIINRGSSVPHKSI